MPQRPDPVHGGEHLLLGGVPEQLVLPAAALKA